MPAIMSRPRRRRAALVAATVLTAGLALAGCSAGTVTQTDTTLSGAPGAFGSTGDILIRDLTIDAGPNQVAQAGGPAVAALQGTIVNDGATSDRLVSVTTPYAQSVTAEGATTIPGDNALRLVGTQPGPVGPAQPDTRVAATARLSLRGVTQTIRPGPTYAVTFTFERSGQVTIPVIVQSTNQPAAG
jgi:periplasmic copper chaperone A